MQLIFKKKMKTIIVNVPDKDESLLIGLLKKMGLKSKILSGEEVEDRLMAKWINEGMKSEDVPMEKIVEHLRKNGVDC